MNSYSRLTSIFLGVSFFISCKTFKPTDNNAPTPLAYTYLKEVESVHPDIQGVWQSIGNGYLLDARADSIHLYSYTQSYCYKEKNDYLEGLLNTQSQFILRSDTMALFLTDYGEETKFLQSKKDFIRISQLPETCLSLEEMNRLSNRQLFELYKESMMENFAFSVRRNLDWDRIFSKFQDSIFRNHEALFASMGEIATLTKDQHTKVISKEGVSLQYRITPSALDVQKSFEQQTEIKELNQYFDLFFQTSYKNISDSLLNGKGEKVANGKIEWGNINGNLGYISIHSFAGFLGKDFSRKQQVDTIRKHMDHIIQSLQTKDAIIVDISFNFGGYDASAITIASYFTETVVEAYTLQVYQNGHYYNEDTITIYPSSINYTKPVYLMMTDISRSAAENFGMMMDAFPHVTLVGTRTLGILSGMLGKSIGNFYTTFSNQRLITSEGNYFEATGLKPDIPLKVFPVKDVMNGHKNAVIDIVYSIRNKP